MTITFRNLVQKNLFDIELSGQISDGHWENARPMDHWKDWCNTNTEVGEKVGRDFYTQKDNYNLSDKFLLDCVGDRMLNICKMTLAGFTKEEINLCYDNSLEDLEKYSKDGNQYWIDKLESYKKVGLDRLLKAKDIKFEMKDMRKELKDMKLIMKIKK